MRGVATTSSNGCSCWRMLVHSVPTPAPVAAPICCCGLTAVDANDDNEHSDAEGASARLVVL